MIRAIQIFGFFVYMTYSTWLFGQVETKGPLLFALDINAIQVNKQKVNNKNLALIPSYKELLRDADKSLLFGPVSVMEKLNIPPSGNKHDYMSLAPYFWPDPSKPNGLPYMRKDGETNPEVKDYKDKEYLPALCEAVYTLSLANYFSDEDKYAKHAIKLLQVWFLDTATKMNPNLNFGQAIKGQNTGRGAGLIDTRHFIKLIDGINLLHQSEKLSSKDFSALQAWFAEFLNWMQTSKVGQEEMNAKNNHGVWYDAQRISMALLTNQNELAKQIVSNVQKRINNQMDSNGFFPAELERTISLHYSLFVLEPLMQIAQMAKIVQVDLINYQSPNGNSIKKGIDALLPYLMMEKTWTGQQIKPFNYNEAIPLLAMSNVAFNCIKCKDAIKKIHPSKPESLRIHLLTKNDL
ncbi:MAG: alginate lyase family protein [Sphingobacteriia bacterium]|jgi:hypothetical protein